jgi:predicted nuclease of predicted toxin-antitoxin system
MRLLADQDVYAMTVRILRSRSHDVATASDLGLSQAADVAILQAAIQDRRILLTRDRDYGGLVFAGNTKGGVIYLRIAPSALDAVHDELLRVLDLYSETELQGALIVVEPGRHRLRKIAP